MTPPPSKLPHPKRLRNTRARLLVVEVLEKLGQPLSHQEIAMHPKAQEIDRVTIYRTLMALKKHGLVHRIQDGLGTWRFCRHRSASKEHCGGNHIHFLCTKCNQMICLPEQPLPWVEAPKGAEITSKQLLVSGHCAKCGKKEKRK